MPLRLIAAAFGVPDTEVGEWKRSCADLLVAMDDAFPTNPKDLTKNPWPNFFEWRDLIEAII